MLSPLCGGSFSDIYQATKGDEPVALKALRVHLNTLTEQKEKLRKVLLKLSSVDIISDPFVNRDF